MNSSSDNQRKMALHEAARYLNVSPRKMGQMIKEGVISFTIDPLDKRRRLVRVGDLDSLKRASLTPR